MCSFLINFIFISDFRKDEKKCFRGLLPFNNLYHQLNKFRNGPCCSQTENDSFRLFTYDIANEHSTENFVLVTRHNISDGMFMVFVQCY